MAWGLQCVGLGLDYWLESFDPDYGDGRGLATWTDKAARALRFETPQAAHRFYETQSTVRPLRKNGQPNRPLTAYTMTVDPIPEPLL